MGIFEAIKKALSAVWNWIKKVYQKVINFFSNIANWFKQPERLKKVQENKDLLAISIKENLENGNYNVVNCLFNEKTGKLVDYEEDTISITAEDLDSATKRHFGDKEMLVLQ